MADTGLQNTSVHYLCQGGYVIIVACLSISNFVQKLGNGFA